MTGTYRNSVICFSMKESNIFKIDWMLKLKEDATTKWTVIGKSWIFSGILNDQKIALWVTVWEWAIGQSTITLSRTTTWAKLVWRTKIWIIIVILTPDIGRVENVDITNNVAFLCTNFHTTFCQKLSPLLVK